MAGGGGRRERADKHERRQSRQPAQMANADPQAVHKAFAMLFRLAGGIACIIILTEFVNWLASSKPVPLSFYKKDLFIISIWFFVVNGIYIGLFKKKSNDTKPKVYDIKVSILAWRLFWVAFEK